VASDPFGDFFKAATEGYSPYAYQRGLASVLSWKFAY
jgi:hypothetical protein